jgi:hypothetical protein
VETVAAPVEKVEGDEQNMDSGKVEGRSLKGCEVLPPSMIKCTSRFCPMSNYFKFDQLYKKL